MITRTSEESILMEKGRGRSHNWNTKSLWPVTHTLLTSVGIVLMRLTQEQLGITMYQITMQVKDKAIFVTSSISPEVVRSSTPKKSIWIKQERTWTFSGLSETSFNTHLIGQATSAHIATPEVVQDPAWYVDSGATNHVTQTCPISPLLLIIEVTNP